MTFIIAEIGINHNGDLGIAKEMINVAKDAGCNAVKFQKRTIDTVYTREFLDSPRESPWGTTQREQKDGLEFGIDEYEQINDHCKKLGIDWFASAWDLNSQMFLRQFELKYNKIASAMLNHKPLVDMIASECKHTFISTGMASIEDIKEVVEKFEIRGCHYELMHTVSIYPMPVEKANLKRINSLKQLFGRDIGYSGHEVGLSVSCAALGIGISSLERHITLDRSMYGSDQSSSLEPNGLRQLVKYSREINLALGDGKVVMQEGEQEIAEKLKYYI